MASPGPSHAPTAEALLKTPPQSHPTAPSAPFSGRHRRQSGRLNTPSSRTRKGPGGAHSSRSLLSTPQPPEDNCQAVARLQGLLEAMPDPAPRYKVRRAIGQGTFSTVYLAEVRPLPAKSGDEGKEEDHQASCSSTKSPPHPEIAVKHLVPTSSPDRILMEVECLRLSGGEANVLPLLFCHRLKGDVVLALPYVKQAKFGEVIRTMTYKEMVSYMKNLLVALAHIHSLGIIHRDVKPANFLFDFQTDQFGLVDFGLAQMTGEIHPKPSSPPACKRKLTSSDLGAPSSGSPVKKKSRPALANKTSEVTGQRPRSPKTPTHNYGSNPAYDFYDRRGSLRKTPLKSKIYFDPEDYDEEKESDYSRVVTPRKSHRTTFDVGGACTTSEIRRSPRKHHSISRKATGFSKLTISGSAIVGSATSASLKRTPSFTILDPTSGIPSDCTPRLQASLTSRSHSFNSSSHVRFNTPTLIDMARCDCYGLPKLCTKCSGRRSQKAARAGTPGFRPPEVLLKSEHQTTAVDLWAAGVIMLCIMSRSYPFFRAPDDLTALAEILCIFGTDRIREAACQYGKKFLCSEVMPGVDLRTLCHKLASREGSVGSAENLATVEAVDLMSKLLKLLSHERISAEEALRHPIFKG